jgi:hypothetical protein
MEFMGRADDKPAASVFNAKSGPHNERAVAYIGCGTQGIREMLRMLTMSEVQIVAVCDPALAWTQNDPYGSFFVTRFTSRGMREPRSSFCVDPRRRVRSCGLDWIELNDAV